MADKYIEEMTKVVKDSKTDQEIETVLNRIYEDGYIDGREDN